MNEECSHIAQWEELSTRAKNFCLNITFDSTAFYLWNPWAKQTGGEVELGKYLTLADLRAGISDYVAGERAAGRMKI